jgi:undecaprenyl-diphosphatase
VKTVIARTVGVALLLLAMNYLLLLGLGLLVTKILHPHSDLLRTEDQVNEDLADSRTPALNDVSFVLSGLGNTLTIIALLVLVTGGLLYLTRRWKPSLFLVLAVSGQALVFLLVTLSISRNRPDVPKLDDSPPTSSFPSGHTGASTALYVGLALLVLWMVRQRWIRALGATLLLAFPILVALSRLYRGMHHPSDIVAAYINGGICLAIGAGLVLGLGPLAWFQQSADRDSGSPDAVGDATPVGTG